MRVRIERLGHHGDGIADGPVFVPRALPGEVVEGDVSDGRISAPRIITPSPDRVSPPCLHYKSCGGCALQHASDAFVSEWKLDIVRQAMTARGLKAPLRRLHTSPARSRRRATFSGRRTKKGAHVGFHAPASDIIREIENCILVRPALLDVLPVLEAAVIAGGTRKGEIRFLVTETETGLDISATGGKPLDLPLQERLSEIIGGRNVARMTWDDEPVAISRRPLVTLGSVTVSPPPGAFLQATSEGEAALRASVETALAEVRGRVADLFSGIGTFALPLAKSRPVHAVEADKAMLAALDDGWRHGEGLHEITCETRDLFRRPLDTEELARFDAVVIDPPRAGAEAQMLELAHAGVPRIVAVSCNAVTFARDAGLLVKSGYDLAWIDVIDQFRWSTHVELVALFERRG